MVPGNADASELLRRITAQRRRRANAAGEDKPLTAEQVELVRQWIAEGAEWNGHWAFRAVGRAGAPRGADGSWGRGDDRRLYPRATGTKRAGAAPPAEKAALLRRATYDLTGLPPTPAEVDAFLADRVARGVCHGGRPAAGFAASMASIGRRHWLDVVRYADTNSFERDARQAERLALSRLRHSLAQCRQALRPILARAAGRRRAARQRRPTRSSPPASIAWASWDDEPADREQARYEELDDIVTTTSQAVLA